MKAMTALAAFATLAFATPASAQMEFTEAEISALARVAMPRAFQSVQQRCERALPQNAYIYAHGPELLTRFQVASSGAWPEARSAIIGLASRDNPDFAGILQNLPPEALQPFIDEMIAGMVMTKVQADQCAQIDRVLSLLDPLPPENLAELLGFFVVESQKDKAQS